MNVANHLQKEALEGIIDHIGMPGILAALADIGFEKEEHVITQWQDSHLADQWMKMAERVEKLAFELEEEFAGWTT